MAGRCDIDLYICLFGAATICQLIFHTIPHTLVIVSPVPILTGFNQVLCTLFAVPINHVQQNEQQAMVCWHAVLQGALTNSNRRTELLYFIGEHNYYLLLNNW